MKANPLIAVLAILLIAACLFLTKTEEIQTDYKPHIQNESVKTLEKVVYSNGAKIMTLSDGTKSITDGVATYLRWDGDFRPQSELDIATGNFPYLVQDNTIFYTITSNNASFRHIQPYNDFHFEPGREPVIFFPD